jgi:peptide/nickel transport system permease protein
VTAFVLRRLLLSIPVLFAASVLIFLGVSSVGDPLAELRLSPNVSQATIDNITARKHLDQPLVVQYGLWVKEALTDRFGTYLLSDEPIWPDLRRAMANTLQLVVAAEAIALTLAIGLGVASAKRQYSLFDYTATTLSFFGFSMPIFWFALILQVITVNLFDATGVRIFYTSGLSSVDAGSGWSFLLDRLQHLALPIIALSIVSVATYSRYMRAAMLEVIGSDYVRTARAKGVPEGRVTRRHAMRNALIPVVTVATLHLGVVFGGVIVTETVFSLDGMGLFFIRALAARDVYPLMAWLMVSAIAIIVFNLLADVVYSYLDPRIRHD